MSSLVTSKKDNLRLYIVENDARKVTNGLVQKEKFLDEPGLGKLLY